LRPLCSELLCLPGSWSLTGKRGCFSGHRGGCEDAHPPSMLAHEIRCVSSDLTGVSLEIGVGCLTIRELPGSPKERQVSIAWAQCTVRLDLQRVSSGYRAHPQLADISVSKYRGLSLSATATTPCAPPARRDRAPPTGPLPTCTGIPPVYTSCFLP
jgi:hypothetical protein